MSQDTRKDKRAKVVSLNVRYKSATVDEFIENHSHDVSKGGLFVKTPTPFPPGTLLKFEIRLAGDKSVISGVGRVVWKREPTQSGAEKPAGMGVKFIKIDDSSRAIIDRLIMQKADAGSAYTSEQPVDEPPAGHPSTLRGLVAATPVEPGPPPGPSPVNAPAPAAGASAKLPVPPQATSSGLPPPPAAKNPALGGTLAGPRPSGLPNVPPSAPVPPPAPSSKPALSGGLGAPKPPPRPAGPAAPVPKAAAPAPTPAPVPVATKSAPAVPDKPPSEPKLGGPPRPPPPARKATMMGMGAASTPPPPTAEGSLPSPAPPPAAGRPATAEPMFPRLDPDSGTEPVRDQTVMKQAAELLEEALKEAGGLLDEIGQNPLFSQAGEASVDTTTQRPGQVQAVQSGDTMIMASPMPSPSSISPSSPLGGPAPGMTAEASSVRAGSSPSQPLILDAPVARLASAPPPVSSPRKLSEDLDSSSSKKKGGSMGALLGLLVVLLLVGGGVYAWQTGMLGGGAGPAPTPPSATTPPTSPPSATTSAPLAAAPDAAPAETAAPAAVDAAAAVPTEVDAGKAVTTGVAPPKPPTPPRPPPRPPTPPKPPPVETTTTATAEPTPPPAPTPTPPPAPTPTAPPSPTMEPWSPP